MSLSEILSENARKAIEDTWASTSAAEDYSPMTCGNYNAKLLKLKTGQIPNGKPYLKLIFQIEDGEFCGRRVSKTLWLTPAAMPYTKRELSKIEILQLEELENPIPKHFICRIYVVKEKKSDDREFNNVKSFNVLGFEPEAADPFAPQANPVPNSTPSTLASPTPPTTTTAQTPAPKAIGRDASSRTPAPKRGGRNGNQ